MINPSQAVAMTDKELRKFALSVGATFIVLFGFVLPWVFGKGWVLWPCIVGGALILWGLVHPSSLQPIYRGWMKLGILLNKIVSPIVLGSMFFFVITPAALIVKLLGKELIATSFDSSVDTYRTPSETNSASNYERPY